MKYLKKLICFLFLLFLITSACTTTKNITKISSEQLTQQEIQALNMALDDEYKARATYEKVIQDFGGKRPFVNIIDSEEQHIEMLKTLYHKYDLVVPKDKHKNEILGFPSLKQACAAGVDAEIENAELYDNLLKIVNKQDIKIIFHQLQHASQQNHLPAFEQCAGLN